jgi:hypothetical protein
MSNQTNFTFHYEELFSAYLTKRKIRLIQFKVKLDCNDQSYNEIIAITKKIDLFDANCYYILHKPSTVTIKTYKY